MGAVLALPFIELQQLTLGGLQPNHEASIRDEVLDMKVSAAAHLAVPPPPETLTADTPVPFSIKKLWYELDKFERVTFPVNAPKPTPTRMLQNSRETQISSDPTDTRRQARIIRRLTRTRKNVTSSGSSTSCGVA